MTDARISTEQGLSWLLSQLSWPVIRVRERASVELGALLRHPQLGNATHSALLQWIAAQRLESLAALGLLPPFLLVLLAAPYYRRFAQNRQVGAFVQGVTAAATGAIAGAAYILGRHAIKDVPAALIALTTLVLLFKVKKVPEPLAILTAGIVGIILTH